MKKSFLKRDTHFFNLYQKLLFTQNDEIAVKNELKYQKSQKIFFLKYQLFLEKFFFAQKFFFN
jgi:hypothetical protein